jgi:hypothetical protein
MTSTSILKISNPCVLFPNDLAEAKNKFRELALEFHPDKNTEDTNTVFAHINDLYKRAMEQIQSGVWEHPTQIIVSATDGKKYKINFLTKRSFELGQMYISDTMVAYFVEKKHSALFDNAKNTIKSFRYASDRMKEEAKRYLPELGKTFETVDGRLVMVIKKTPDLLCLRDVLAHFKAFEPRHGAWIISTLHNFTCYLNYIGVSCNDISLDTYFISPEFHSGALLGGWWYATPVGKQLTSVPKRTYGLMPVDVKNNKTASIKTDLELIRAIGREILGDTTGLKLEKMGIPKPIVNWLRLPSSGDAVKDYQIWSKKILDDAFGKRKFVKMELTSKDLYKGEEE